MVRVMLFGAGATGARPVPVMRGTIFELAFRVIWVKKIAALRAGELRILARGAPPPPKTSYHREVAYR